MQFTATNINYFFNIKVTLKICNFAYINVKEYRKDNQKKGQSRETGNKVYKFDSDFS
jgi:hypothetical protein